MDKVKKFLERYVEWLALAVGGLFLGWTVYQYVVQKPVTAQVGSDSAVEPSDIPKKVWEGPGQQIEVQINNTNPPPPMEPTVDYPSQIVGSLSDVSGAVAMDLKTPYTTVPPPIDDTLGPAPVNPAVAVLVAALPVIPAPTELVTSHGHSNVQPPNPAGPNAGGQSGPMVAIDKNWITYGGSIPVAALAKSFADAKIPTAFSNCAIYRVMAVRQEKDAAGNWINETEIPPLDINPLMPLPKIDCNFQDRQDYKTWAETQANVVLIAEPPFYTILQGDVWYEPGAKNPNEKDTQMVADPFDPQNPLAFKGDPNTLLPDERAIYDAAKAKKDATDARRQHSGQPSNTPPSGFQPTNPNNPSSPGSNPNGHGSRGGGQHAVPEPEPENPGNLLMPDGRGYYPTPGAPGNPGGPTNPYPGARQPGYEPGGAQASSVASLPQGSFSPADRVAAAAVAGGNADIKIWVHDTSVQSGKTYRYKLKYIVSNPVAGTTNTCQNPADAQKAWIESGFSQWSADISVESDTNFYAIDNKHGIRFDIFKWKNGVWQMQTVQANPGDRVGSVDTGSPTRTDFDTGWTLVDVREDPSGNIENKILVLVSDNGTVKQKEISVDRQNAEYRKLLGEVMADRQKTASAGGEPSPVR